MPREEARRQNPPKPTTKFQNAVDKKSDPPKGSATKNSRFNINAKNLATKVGNNFTDKKKRRQFNRKNTTEKDPPPSRGQARRPPNTTPRTTVQRQFCRHPLGGQYSAGEVAHEMGAELRGSQLAPLESTEAPVKLSNQVFKTPLRNDKQVLC